MRIVFNPQRIDGPAWSVFPPGQQDIELFPGHLPVQRLDVHGDHRHRTQNGKPVIAESDDWKDVGNQIRGQYQIGERTTDQQTGPARGVVIAQTMEQQEGRLGGLTTGPAQNPAKGLPRARVARFRDGGRSGRMHPTNLEHAGKSASGIAGRNWNGRPWLNFPVPWNRACRYEVGMRHLLALILPVVLLSQAPLCANPQAAKLIQEEWDKASSAWNELAAKATTREQRIQLASQQPDPAAFAGRMWQCISTSLDQPWTLEPAAWFLRLSQGLRSADGTKLLFEAQAEQIKKAVLTHHLKASGIEPMCMTLAQSGDPLSLSILEKIESSHPDTKTQGVAALAASIVIKGLGDEPDLIRRRLTHLRKAIIESADVPIGTTTVAKIAENELYQIRYLSKGRTAPELSGPDAQGKEIRLSDHQGRVVVLVFWRSDMPQSQHTIDFTREMVAKLKEKPVVVLGINHDAPDKLRAMTTDGTIGWKNISDPEMKLAQIYRVGTLPMTYVLDEKLAIRYAGALGSFTELTAATLAEEMK